MSSRFALALFCLAPLVALAQGEDTATPHQTEATDNPTTGDNPVAAPKPKPAPKLNPEEDKPEVTRAARAFFSSVILGDAKNVSEQCLVPFQLEDRRINTSDEVMQAWQKALRQKRTDLLTLYGVEVLTPQEMETKHGKPPARLKDFPYKKAGVYIAVANLSGHAAIAVFQKVAAGDWAVIAYHD